MGAWGPGLYSDDVTEDVRGIYVDKLHRGKNGEQASKEMIAEFEWACSDEDDAPVFWFAMADMQWNYGRLQEEVKKKALYYLDDMKNLQRWEHENPKMAEKRKQVLNELRKKLNTLQPSEKKVSQYRLYHCQWKVGDMYAYQLEGEYAKERGLNGKYLLFYKIAESIWWPGHVIPVVYIKLTENNEIPKTREELEKLEYIQASVLNSNDFSDKFIIDAHGKWKNRDFEADEYGYLSIYRFQLISTSKKSIPKKLSYIGNFLNLTPPDKEFIMEIKENIRPIDWKKVEEDVLTKYFLYNKRDITPEFKGLLDTVSISLNTSNKEDYLKLTRSQYGIDSFDELLDFAKKCKAYVPHVVLTIVDTTIPEKDVEICKQIAQNIGVTLRIRPFED